MSGNPDRLTNADAVAEVLGANPPRLDELSQARIEKRLLADLRGAARSTASLPPRRRATGRRYVVAALGVAAAALLGFFALRSPGSGERQARMELRTVGATVQSGTIDEGSSLRTGADEVADIRIDDSRLHLEPSTDVRIETLTDGHLAFELRSGEIRVEFHPRVRGEERMTVRTSRALVEVVGTVFTVRETETFTEVAVREGRVRVSSRDGERRSVGAGESTRVRDGLAAAREARPPTPSAVVEDEPAGAPEPDEVAARPMPQRPTLERERRMNTPAQRLSRARRRLREGDETERTAELLRSLTVDPDASRGIRAQAYTLLGDLLRSRRDFAAAARAFEGAADQGAGQMSQMAIYALARLEERQMHDPAAAARSYHRYLDAGGGPLVGQARAALCRLGESASCGAPEAAP